MKGGEYLFLSRSPEAFRQAVNLKKNKVNLDSFSDCNLCFMLVYVIFRCNGCVCTFMFRCVYVSV